MRDRSVEAYLALDQGGHASRALVFDRRGRVLASSLARVRERRDRRGVVEQDPEELVRTLRRAVREAMGRLGGGVEVVAAGLATQRSSVVCWDRKTGTPLSPVLSWQDRRAARRDGDDPRLAREVRRRTGLRLSPHYGAAKLRWCLDHLPEVRTARRRGRLVAGPLASFLVQRLAPGETARADPANAARTILWNYRTGDWDPWLLRAFGIPREVVPDAVPSVFPWGRLARTGRDVPLRLVTGDQSCVPFAWGAPRGSRVVVNMGTGAFLQLPLRSPRRVRGLLTSTVLHNGRRPVLMLEGTVNGASSALDLYAVRLGVTGLADRLREWMEKEEHPPVFLNGVSGLGSPYWRPRFRSRFVGDGGVAARMVAVAESIVFLIQANLERMLGAGFRPRSLRLTGGLSGYDGLCRRLASLSGFPVERPDLHEATAQGLGFLVAGRPREWGRDAAAPEAFPPREDEALRERYRRWKRALLDALAGGG